MLRSEPRIRFVCIGGGAGMTALEQACRQRGLDSVQFRPYQPRERLRQSLGLADVHLVILRPELEGLIVPSKVYGILAAGRPALFIGAKDGEIAQLLAAGQAGRQVGVGEGERLAAEIRSLAADPESCARLGHNARALFERCCSREQAFAAWHKMLEELRAEDTF